MWDNFDINKVSNTEFKLGYIKPIKAGEVVLVEIEEEDKSSEIEFNSEEGNAEVLQGGIYHSDNKALIVKEWVREMDFSKEELFLVPIWVKKNKVKDPKMAATIEPERDTNPSTTDLKTMQLKSNRR
ncbi:hypothetical protein BC332_28215 [Capsicum chinense]|nr:hypothetical protein BC332_28215 [Capsicum chinense]